MLQYEGIGIQLIGVPSVAATHEKARIANTLQPADAARLVVDLGHAGCVGEVVELKP